MLLCEERLRGRGSGHWEDPWQPRWALLYFIKGHQAQGLEWVSLEGFAAALWGSWWCLP